MNLYSLIRTTELVQCVSGDDVPAHQSHGRVVICALLAQDRTRKHTVVSVVLAQVYLYLQNLTCKTLLYAENEV